MGFDLIFQKLALLSLPLSPLFSTWIAPMFICMGERYRNVHPPFSPFCTILFFFLFRFSLTRNTDTLLLHHNHSGMTIQCPATLEQSGNWVKTSSRIQWSLKISTSQSMFPSGNCHSPEKSIVINWQILFVSNSWCYYSRATNFIFTWCIEKNNTLYKGMCKHCHLTPLCLQGLIKEENLKKSSDNMHIQSGWQKKIVVSALHTERAQNC